MSTRLRALALFALIPVLALSACATVPPSNADPALALVRGRTVADVQAFTIEHCVELGDVILEQSANTLTCRWQIPASGRAVLGALLAGSTAPPDERLDFVMVPRGADVLVTWRASIDMHARDRALRHVRLGNPGNAHVRAVLERFSSPAQSGATGAAH